jgi:hypothetical protein
MSSILLHKEHDGHKAGDVISVSFANGKVLIASGVGEYLDGAKKSVPEVAKPIKAKAEQKPEPPMKPEFPPQPQPKLK